MASDPDERLMPSEEALPFGLTALNTRLHQALFGYRRGHRLLIGSMALEGESMSRLLSATDPSGWGEFDSRTAGGAAVLPLAGLRSVAVMRAWPDASAGRPGAVIAHVIFISISDLAVVSDPSLLLGLLRRPEASEDIASYGQPITVTLPTFGVDASGKEALLDLPSPWPINWHGPPPATLGPTKQLLAAVYTSDTPASNNLPSISRDVWEAIVGQMWAQQWARVRRSFSFTSIPVLSDSPAQKWFRLAPPAEGSSRAERSAIAYPEWLELAAYDLHIGNSKLREFLRNYGVDEPSTVPFNGFGELVQIFLRLEKVAAESKDLAELIDRNRVVSDRLGEIATFLADRYPEPDSLARLKEDLFGRGMRTLHGSSLRPSAAARLAAVLALGTAQSLFNVRAFVDSYRQLWVDPAQSQELTEALKLLEYNGHLRQLTVKTTLLGSIVEAAASSLTPQSIDAVTNPFTRTFVTAVARRRLDLSTAPELWRHPLFASAMIDVFHALDMSSVSELAADGEVINAAIRGLATTPSGAWAQSLDSEAYALAAVPYIEDFGVVAPAYVLSELFRLLGQRAIHQALDVINAVDDVLPAESPLVRSLGPFGGHAASWLVENRRITVTTMATLARAFDPREGAWQKVDYKRLSNLLKATTGPFDETVRGEAAAFYLVATKSQLASAETSRVAWRTFIELADAGQLSNRAWFIWSGQNLSHTRSREDRVSKALDAYASLALKRGWSEQAFREGLPSSRLYESALRLLITKQKEQGASATITRILDAAARSDDHAIRAVASIVRPLFVSESPSKPSRSKKRRK